MHRDPAHQRILGLFADLLDYPAPGLAEKAAECTALLGAVAAAPEAVALLEGFRGFVEATSLGRLEEVYSSFFDLNPLCHPYVGYQLFGENYKRSSFLLQLKECYRAAAFKATEAEMADRLSNVLRYVSKGHGGEDTAELVREGLVPAVERMTRKPEESHGDHDAHVEFDGDTGVERSQLEGHEHGEVLAGGFLLELSAEDEGAGPGEKRPHPYHQALEALRLVLQRAWPA